MREILPLEDLTVSQLLRRTAQRFPGRPALEYMGRVWTYREFDEAVDQTARRLLTWGVGWGDRVGLWCETEPNAILLLYALPRIGAMAALLNTSLQRAELAELLRRAEVDRLIVTDGYKSLSFPALCQGLTDEVPTLKAVLYAGLSGKSGGFPALDSLDKAGNLHLTGRLKELIIRGGENISPAEVESALGDCCEIRECKAVGVPDRHYGEEMCLCVVRQEGAELDEAEIRAILTRRLAPYKVPKYIAFFDELPKTIAGKVRPQELSQLVQERLKLL